jgi:hypothetical protein
MLCRPEITAATDRPIWIARGDFDRYVHRQNFLCRDVQHVHTDAYFADWFQSSGTGGPLHFCLPSIALERGLITFINGRHRTAVLLAHVELIPMAVVTSGGVDQPLFVEIRHSDLDLGCLIEIPDLPILSKDDLQGLIDRSQPRIPTPDPW